MRLESGFPSLAQDDRLGLRDVEPRDMEEEEGLYVSASVNDDQYGRGRAEILRPTRRSW